MSPMTPQKVHLFQLTAQLRFLLTLMSGIILLDTITPILMSVDNPKTMFSVILGLTHRSELVILLLLSCCSLLVPHVALNIFGHSWRRCREITKLSIIGLVGLAIIWTYLMFLSWKVDTGWVTFMFIRVIAENLAFAALLAMILNNSLKRERGVEERRKTSDKFNLGRLRAAIQIHPHEENQEGPNEFYSSIAT
jgi:hypothetical protein